MVHAAQEIIKMMSGYSEDEFLDHDMLKYACVFQLEVIGEAANHISDETKALYQLDWVNITGLRNLLIHEYFGIDYRKVWEVICEFVPALVKELKKQ